MFKTFSTQAAALSLAALATLATMGSLNGLAARDAAHTAVAGSEPVQQVVVVGQRVARS